MRRQGYTKVTRVNSNIVYRNPKPFGYKRKRWHPITVCQNLDLDTTGQSFTFKELLLNFRSVLETLTTAVIIKDVSIKFECAAGVKARGGGSLFDTFNREQRYGPALCRDMPATVKCALQPMLARQNVSGKVPLKRILECETAGVSLVANASHTVSCKISIRMIYLMRKIELHKVHSQDAWLTPTVAPPETPLGKQALTAEMLHTFIRRRRDVQPRFQATSSEEE